MYPKNQSFILKLDYHRSMPYFIKISICSMLAVQSNYSFNNITLTFSIVFYHAYTLFVSQTLPKFE